MNDQYPLDTDLLRTFMAVAKNRNVTRAAHAMHRTQSAISIQIKKLEDRLGASVFLRESRGVRLTELGERLFEIAGRVIGDLDQSLLSLELGEIDGPVRIGIPDEYGLSVLPRVLADFATRNPAVEVSVQCGFSVEFPKMVEQGVLDLAVFADARNETDSEELAVEPTAWVASRAYQDRRDEPVPLALFDRACYWRDMAIEALEKSRRPHRIVVTSESVAGIKAAIVSGLAIGVLARSTIDDSMQILGKKDGFPALPKSNLRLLRGKHDSPAIHAMGAAIETGFSRLR